MIPAQKVARRLGISRAELMEKLSQLYSEGFPQADPVLGTFCLQAVDNWIDQRAGLKPPAEAMSPGDKIREAIRLGAWGT